MCHNFNYSDEHRGHKVVTLAEAYKVIKKQATLNLNLLEKMQNLVQYRIRYTNQCRYDIERDLRKSQKSLAEYIDKIINDLYLLKQQKMDELVEEYRMRDEYMVQNHDALQGLSEQIKKFTDKEPDSLMAALKQYKGKLFHLKIGTTGFIKALTNGIIFPSTNDVFINLRLPKYDNIRKIISECEAEMDITSKGLPENVIDIINPLKESKIIPEKEQTDVILNVLPNFESSELGKLIV